MGPHTPVPTIKPPYLGFVANPMDSRVRTASRGKSSVAHLPDLDALLPILEPNRGSKNGVS